MDYALIGSMEVRRDGTIVDLGGLKQRAVLAVLLLARGKVVEFDKLIDAVWNESPPDKAITSVRAYVANLRRVLDSGVAEPGVGRRLVTMSFGYRLDLTAGDDSIDIVRFETLASAGRAALASGDASAAASRSSEALALWRGTPLADFRDHAFAFDVTQRLEEIYADTFESLIDARLLLGAASELVPELEDRIRIDPLRERLWGQLMLALYRAGRRADALLAFERAKSTLSTELGIEPGAALAAMDDDIRTQAPALDWIPPRSDIRAVARIAPTPVRTVFGREHEVQQLHEVLRSARSGRGQVVVIAGDSGVGKTSLAAEIATDAAGTGMATAWSSHAGGVRKPALWPWIQILRRLTESDAARDVDIATRRAVAAVAPELFTEGRSTSDDIVADAPPMAPSAFGTVEAIANAVHVLVRSTPTLIVLDDFHRADRASHDVLELLEGGIHEVPLAIVATWQDGGLDRPVRRGVFDRLLSRCDTTLLRLRGVDIGATAELIEYVGGVAAPEPFAARMLERTGGNPFYIRELVRMLRSDGRLEMAAAGPLPAHIANAVPDAVAGVIRRRMAALPKATRTALGVAAVVGTDFGSSFVARELGVGPSTAHGVLEPAVDAGFLTLSATTPTRLGFAHGLVRDAILSTLASSERAALHADTARAFAPVLDRIGREEAVAAADHAWRASDDLDAPTALTLVNHAIGIAASRYAYIELADLCTAALEISRRLPIAPERDALESSLWLHLTSVLMMTKGIQHPDTVAALRHATETGAAERVDLEVASMGAQRAMVACAAARYRECEELSDALIDQFEGYGHTVAGSAGFFFRGMAKLLQGDVDGCLDAIDFLLSEVPQQQSESVPLVLTFDVRAYGAAAWAHAIRGDIERARAMIEHGIEVGADRGDEFGIAALRTALVQMAAVTGDYVGATELADAVRAETSALGMAQLTLAASMVRAWAHAMETGADTAPELRSGIGEHTADGTKMLLPLYLALLSDVDASQGRFAEALSAARRAEAAAAATGERIWDPQLRSRVRRLRAVERTGSG